MSTSKQMIHDGKTASNLPVWTTPAILLLINALAFSLCVLGSPWNDSPIAGLLILVLSALPLAALGYLTMRIYRSGKLLREELASLWAASEPTPLMARAEHLHKKVRQAREQAEARLEGDSLTEFSILEAPPLTLRVAESDMLTAMEGYVMQRYLAGEDLRLDALRNFLNEYVLDRVEQLQRDHELAFGIGLAGTVLGLGVQISLTQWLAQTSILSQPFLTGVVLKAGSTFVGILVAWYARSLRWQILEQYDQLVARLEDFASSHLAPLLVAGRAGRGDLAEVLSTSIKSLNKAVKSIETNLKAALSEAVEKASETLGEQLKETFATQLAESIKLQITEPFRVEVERLNHGITQAGDNIAEGVRGLKEGSREFKEEFANLVKASFNIGDQLRDASHVLNSLTHKFEEIVTQANQVTQTMREFQGEVELAIERSRSQDSDHNNHWMRGEVEMMMKAMREDRQSLTNIIDGLNERRPRNK